MLRKVSSLTALLSFILLLLTSVILYIVPAGRGGLLGRLAALGVEQKPSGPVFTVNLGILFLVAILFHTWFNWGSILAYLKNKAREIRIFTPAFNISLILVIAFTIGTYAQIPPFFDAYRYKRDNQGKRRPGIMASHPYGSRGTLFA